MLSDSEAVYKSTIYIGPGNHSRIEITCIVVNWKTLNQKSAWHIFDDAIKHLKYPKQSRVVAATLSAKKRHLAV